MTEQKEKNWIHPIELVVVQSTGFCNLNCKYCYLLEETRKTKGKISLPLLITYFSKILSSKYLNNRLIVSWHSGEPMVLGIEYYKSAIEEISKLKRQYCEPGFEILHDIQTNGTLIDENWCAFFKKYRRVLTIGISCDGPSFLHDSYRKDWKNSGSFEKTLQGIKLLAKNNIAFSLIAVVSPRTLDYPNEFFDFFYSYRSKISEFRFNLLDEFYESGEFSYNTAEKYYNFLKTILDRIQKLGAQDDFLNIKNFSHFYNRLFSDGRIKQTAHYTSIPFRAVNIAINGDFSTFYAGLSIDESPDAYGDNKGLVLGNLNDHSLEEIAESPKLSQILEDFRLSHTVCENTCSFFGLCPGGFDLIKFKRHGTFDVSETPECKIQVQTFSKALMDHMSAHIKV